MIHYVLRVHLYTKVSSIRLPSGPCNSFSLCTSPAGPLVALACADHSVRLMRMELGRTLWTASALQLQSASDSEAAIEEQTPRVRDPVAESALSITCVGDLLAVGTDSGRVLVLDARSGLRYSDNGYSSTSTVHVCIGISLLYCM